MAVLNAAAGWYLAVATLQALLGAFILARRRGPFPVLVGMLFVLNALGALGWAIDAMEPASFLGKRIIHSGDDPTGLLIVLLGLLLWLEAPLDRARWPLALVVGGGLAIPVALALVVRIWTIPDPNAGSPFFDAVAVAPVYLGYSLVVLGLTGLVAREGRVRAGTAWLLVAFGSRVAEFAPQYANMAVDIIQAGAWEGRPLSSAGAIIQLGAFLAACGWLAFAALRRTGVQRHRVLFALATLLAFFAMGIAAVAPGFDLGRNTVIIATVTLYLVRPVAYGIATERRALIEALLWTASVLSIVAASRAGLHALVGVPFREIIAPDILVLGLALMAVAALARPMRRLTARVELLAENLGGADRPRVLVRYMHAAQLVEGASFAGATREEIAASTSIRSRHVGIVADVARDRLREHLEAHDGDDPLLEEFEERTARVKKRYRLTARGMQAAQRMLSAD